MDKPREMLADYDREMLGDVARGYYDDSDFYNYGYWLPGTRTQRHASENLIENLLSRLPSKTGRILDAACGAGGSTRYLGRYFAPQDIYAVNLSAAQAGLAHRNAPDCGVAVMDAVRLGFADGAFDNLICLESVFHFDTRRDFFKEAHRVLKPGGGLVLTDILYRSMSERLSERAHLPHANRLQDAEQYRRVLASEGFRDVEVVDATAECARGFTRNLLLWPFRSLVSRPSSYRDFLPRLKLALTQGGFSLLVKHYLIVSAIRD
jgi:SAM-dependent methyltransferase